MKLNKEEKEIIAEALESYHSKYSVELMEFMHDELPNYQKHANKMRDIRILIEKMER